MLICHLFIKTVIYLLQDDENKPKSHSPIPIMDGDDDMHDMEADDEENMYEFCVLSVCTFILIILHLIQV